jgi:hypothetical protein
MALERPFRLAVPAHIEINAAKTLREGEHSGGKVEVTDMATKLTHHGREDCWENFAVKQRNLELTLEVS